MHIELNKIGKRFNREWIFKELDFIFLHQSHTAILGPNGSGKSTLLLILSGMLSQTSGKISYRLEEKSLPVEDVYKHLSIVAPYLELPEEMTLSEIIDFHFSFKAYSSSLNKETLIQCLAFEKVLDKEIRYFSSGMKQRLKLILALCSNTSLVLLDEPCSNLDQQGIDWYRNLIRDFGMDKTLVIASNQAHEYEFCKQELNILNYK